MNVVIAGPFGHGTLADEAVLAGLLRHLARGKHQATVMSQDPGRTEEVHGVPAVQASAPESFLSNRELWTALGKAHLLVLASGGVISAEGHPPARAWLALLEHAQTAGLQTAAVGLGAREIRDPKERARVQRLLHNCTGAISTRDAGSKQILMSYGLGASSMSASGDPALALAGPADAHPEPRRFGVVLADGIPSRLGFGVEPRAPAPALLAAAQALLQELLSDSASAVTLFHDDTAPAREASRTLAAGARAERVRTQAADGSPVEIQARMAECSALFSLSLHGLILAAGAGVPVAGCAAEPGAAAFLAALGLSQFALPEHEGVFSAAAAAAALHELAARTAELRAAGLAKVAALRRKETQNARLMECLVPRRIARERERDFPADEQHGDEETPRARREARRGRRP